MLWSEHQEYNMARTLLNSFQVNDAGHLYRSQFDYVTTNGITIGPGEYGITDGTTPKMVFWNSNISYTTTSNGAETWSYLYIDYSSIGDGYLLTSANFIDSQTAPTWNQTRKGWYNGDDRAIFAFKCNGSSQIKEFDHDGGDLLMLRSDYSEGSYSGNNNATWSAITLNDAPPLASRVQCTFYQHGTTTLGIFQSYWRKYGTTGSHFVAKTEDDEAEFVVSAVPVFTDSSQRIEVMMYDTNANAGSNPTLYVYTTGWYIPRGM